MKKGVISNAKHGGEVKEDGYGGGPLPLMTVRPHVDVSEGCSSGMMQKVTRLLRGQREDKEICNRDGNKRQIF